MFGVSLFMCGFVCLVESQNQYQQYQYPYGTSYASIYGTQPIVVTPASSYNQAYSVQSPSLYPETNSVTNQLQDIYLNNIFSNPAIQAFIDPGTKIYNQNGVEISDQVRPKSPNVVNNYFIVPTDYLKINESRARLKSTRYKNQNYYNTYRNRYTSNDRLKESRDSESNVSQFERKPKSRKSNQRETETSKKHKTLQDSNIILEDQIITNRKQKEVEAIVKREDEIPTKLNVNSKKRSKTNSEQQRLVTKSLNQKDKKPKYEPNIRRESDVNESDRIFNIKEECCDLDKRNPRNSGKETVDKKNNVKSTKKQNDFMHNWMNYVKMIMPEQNFESFDFSHMNLPYNFEQMYQMSNNNNKQQFNKPKKRNKTRNQKEKLEADTVDVSSKTTESKNKVVQLAPKFIEIEDKEEPTNTKISNNILEEQTKTSEKEENEQNQPMLNSEVSEEEDPIIYLNEIIDYYPDFRNDVIYTTDEDDLYFFHNHHYYNTEEALNRERRKFDRDEETKQPERYRGNEIPSFKKTKTINKVESQFRTPPSLSEPGFKTKKVNLKDKAGFYSYYIHDNDSRDFTPVEKDDNSIETVFARSKVVKYGKPKEVTKQIKYLDEHGNEKQLPKDGDTTVVFAKAWNS